jgi:hypothetical protein
VNEQTYTEAEVARLQESEAKAALRNLLASLEDVRRQRRAAAGLPGQRVTVAVAQARGEVAGLTVAINAIKRRLR